MKKQSLCAFHFTGKCLNDANNRVCQNLICVKNSCLINVHQYIYISPPAALRLVPCLRFAALCVEVHSPSPPPEGRPSLPSPSWGIAEWSSRILHLNLPIERHSKYVDTSMYITDTITWLPPVGFHSRHAMIVRMFYDSFIVASKGQEEG